MSPSHSSPHKPRLLWRGAFHLPDGSALPGLAIVSSTQPGFAQFRHHATSSSSSSSPSTVSLGGDASERNGAVKPNDLTPPFTLSRDHQDELSLSIEMVRHAPLRVVDVLENVETDERGALSVVPRIASSSNNPGTRTRTTNGTSSFSAGAGFGSVVAASSTSNVHVTFEAGGDVRLYIDPSQHATVAYFERLFAYDDTLDEDAEKNEGKESAKDAKSLSYAKTALIFSFDNSIVNSSDPNDVFSDAISTWSSFAGSIKPSQLDSTMEAVVIGIKRRDTSSLSDEGLMELHVGRRMTRRITQAPLDLPFPDALSSSSAIPPPTSSSYASSSSSSSSRPVRPDDPAPRALARFLPRKMSSSSSFSLSKSTSSIDQSRRFSDFVLPPPPLRSNRSVEPALRRTEKHEKSTDFSSESYDVQSVVPSSDAEPDPSSSSTAAAVLPPESLSHTAAATTTTTTRRRIGNHTPGRRGEKRQKRDVGSQLEQSQSTMTIKEEAREDSISIADKDKDTNESFEERNRSLIKKLVHYQLLGKGVERHDDSYVACFGPTCQGATVALRRLIKVELIDKQRAASIVERHLDMYL